MKVKTIRWFGVAVLVHSLALAATAAQEPDSQEAQPSPSRSGEHSRHNAEERWKMLDEDGDGRISRSEWQRSEQAFDRMDTDKDGFLTKEELRMAARKIRGKRRGGLRDMDTDSDGNISRSEWRGKEEMFNRLDANSDGLLSRDELRGDRKQHRPDSPSLDRSEKNTL